MLSITTMALADILLAAGIKPCFHDLIAELSGGDEEYLTDITASDLEGCQDTEGVTIPAPVARGLVRKLQEVQVLQAATIKSPAHASFQPPARDLGHAVDSVMPRKSQLGTGAANGAMLQDDAAGVVGCVVSLLKGTGECAHHVRCAIKSQPMQVGTRRRKVLTVVLDRSGSMHYEWPLVADAVGRVITDELLTDPLISVSAVVYDGNAVEVPLGIESADLPNVLMKKYKPNGGITSFSAAFELAQKVIQREISQHVASGAQPSDIDIATLLFTDGADTSIPPLGTPSKAADAKARTAGDSFRNFLSASGCPHYTCIAAFAEHHNPSQCEYLSDRYCYINRREVLSEWLAGGIGELLGTGGHCSLSIDLPRGITLVETMPNALPLDAECCLDYHVWLHVNDGCNETGLAIVEISALGALPLEGVADFSATQTVAAGAFEEHLYNLDFAAFQLRSLASKLRGQRPSEEEMKLFRAQLIKANDRVQPVRDAVAVATGELLGRSALRVRLAEIDTMRERLSYSLGHFDVHDQDTRHIGTVAIDAILRDVCQHVPKSSSASLLLRQAEKAAALLPARALSPHGKEYTWDCFSCSDATKLARQGDALFFRLSKYGVGADGITIAVDSDGLIGYEAFMLLSKDGKQAIHDDKSGESFTHLGLPLYVSADHFLRSQLLIPAVIRNLSPTGEYTQGVSERLLLSLLGRAMACPHVTVESITALLHKARGVHAVLSVTPSPAGGSLLEDVVAEAARFVDEPKMQREYGDLYQIAASGFLAHDWPSEKVKKLADAIVGEALRRRVSLALRDTNVMQQLWFAWALVGSAADNGDEWLEKAYEEPLSDTQLRPTLFGNGFNPITASDELEALETGGYARPYTPCKAGADALLTVLCGKAPAGAPDILEWRNLHTLLSTWGSRMEQESVAATWKFLDEAMIDSDSDESLKRLLSISRTLRCVEPQSRKLKDILPNPEKAVCIAASECLRGKKLMKDGKSRQPLRLAVASALRELVSRRVKLVRMHPIAGKEYPQVKPYTPQKVREIWGAPAVPVDAALYREARRAVLAKHRCDPLSVKEALTNKEYRRRGGKFVFHHPLDTFIEGLHKRTEDLWLFWSKTQRETSGLKARSQAVKEMLLRLCWDDGDDRAREKLSLIVARIWDSLEGMDLSDAAPLSSALWDHDEPGSASQAASASPRSVTDSDTWTFVPEGK